MEAAGWEIALKILSIVSCLATVILGVTAIWLSLYFYRRSNELYAHMAQMLSRIEASSEATKDTSTELTRPLVDGVVAEERSRPKGAKMTYELAIKLKEAGYPQRYEKGECSHWVCQHGQATSSETHQNQGDECDICYVPTLSELIEPPFLL